MGILRHDPDGQKVVLTTDHVVGRMPSCGLALEHTFVSLAHSLIRWNGTQWELRDLGSTNGTYANGRRLGAGESVLLEVGASVAFGKVDDVWLLTNDSPPVPAAVPLDGGVPALLQSGVIAIPEPDNPLGTVLLENDSWILELPDSRQILAHGSEFTVAERRWRLECPKAAAPTYAAGEAPPCFDDAVLRLLPSVDEEHVDLSLLLGGRTRHFRERTGFYLLLVLTRQRTRDERARLADAGWVDVDELLRMIPDYGSPSALNVEIFRLRRLFHDAGISDAARIVERRRGQLRIGSIRVEVRTREEATLLANQP